MSATIPVVPPWLVTMREISGTKEVLGGADSPIILKWRDEISRRYPDMAAHCKTYTHDSIPWCGLTMAYCMAVNGIKPVNEFLWADNWRKFGTRIDKPMLGCVLTFKRTGGNHVALYEGEEGSNYIIRGGNQSDAVNLMRKPKSELTGIMWPPSAVVQPQPKPVVPAPVVKPVSPATKAAAAGAAAATAAAGGGAAIAIQKGVSVIEIISWIGGLSAVAVAAFVVGYRIIKGNWPWTSTGKASQELLPLSPPSSDQSLALVSAQLALSSAASPETPLPQPSKSSPRRKRSAKPSRKTPRRRKSSSNSKPSKAKKSSRKRKSKSRN